jgi:hypothetical protein
MARIAIKVHPRAKRTAITGRLGEAYKVDVKAPPVDGKANEECVRFFAELAGVPRSSVRIVQGAAGRMKVVEIEGVETGYLARAAACRLSAPTAGDGPANPLEGALANVQGIRRAISETLPADGRTR